MMEDNIILKYGQLEIYQALDNWAHLANVRREPDAIKKALEHAKSLHNNVKNLETDIFSLAYSNTDWAERLDLVWMAVYARGEGIKPRIPEEVIEEAKIFKSKNGDETLHFFADIYYQIVFGIDGGYAQRFKEKKGHIAAVLNYFVDEMLSSKNVQLIVAADNLEERIREEFGIKRIEQNRKAKLIEAKHEPKIRNKTKIDTIYDKRYF